MDANSFVDKLKSQSRWRLFAMIGGGVIVVMIMNPCVVVGAGQRGVVLNFGAVQDRVLGEGLHFRMPIVQKIVKMDVQVQKSQTDAAAASKDLQDTHSTVALNYHIEPDKANIIYQHLGEDYVSRIIDPAVQEALKAITARYTAVDLITQREKVREEVKDLLKLRLVTYNIVVDDVSIVNFKFSEQFAQAIEQKQAAEQMALKASRDLDRIRIEAEQKITQARAEAESLRLQRANVSTDLVALRKIEASIKAIEKWDGHLPKITSGAIPFIDMRELKE